MTVVTIVLSIACFIVGGFASYLFFKHGLKNKYDGILRDAEAEAEVIKKNKLLEVKEKFLNKKADLEKEVAQRNQKIQQAENKLKQRELVLNQRQEEIQRKKMEAEAVKENLEAQLSIVDKKKEELEHMQRQEIEKLEAISGLSAEEAKERMVESLKEEAKTQAQSYINDIMDDAKLTASKEAKRIVIQSIQRVATETAIENCPGIHQTPHRPGDPRPGKPQHPCPGSCYRCRNRGRRHSGSYRIVSLRPGSPRGCTPCTAPVGDGRTHPPGTHRRGSCQSTQAGRRGNHRNR